MNTCIFCKIIKGEIPSKKVYEDEYCYAFNDISPQMPIHILVVSKKHAKSILEFNDDEIEILGGIQLAIGKIARLMGLEENGFRVINNCGKDALQSVAHLHYHILAGGQMGAKIV